MSRTSDDQPETQEWQFPPDQTEPDEPEPQWRHSDPDNLKKRDITLVIHILFVSRCLCRDTEAALLWKEKIFVVNDFWYLPVVGRSLSCADGQFCCSLGLQPYSCRSLDHYNEALMVNWGWCWDQDCWSVSAFHLLYTTRSTHLAHF